MEIVADGLMILAGAAAAFYCLVLSRRLRRLTNLDSGLGAAIATLSTQVEEMRKSLESARSMSGETQQELAQRTARAEIAAGRLELLLAAVHSREARPAAFQRGGAGQAGEKGENDTPPVATAGEVAR